MMALTPAEIRLRRSAICSDGPPLRLATMTLETMPEASRLRLDRADHLLAPAVADQRVGDADHIFVGRLGAAASASSGERGSDAHARQMIVFIIVSLPLFLQDPTLCSASRSLLASRSDRLQTGAGSVHASTPFVGSTRRRPRRSGCPARRRRRSGPRPRSRPDRAARRRGARGSVPPRRDRGWRSLRYSLPDGRPACARPRCAAPCCPGRRAPASGSARRDGVKRSSSGVSPNHSSPALLP